MPKFIGIVISVITRGFKGRIVVELLKKLISTKMLVRWVAPMLLALGAGAIGMQNAEFKEAVCGAQSLDQPK